MKWWIVNIFQSLQHSDLILINLSRLKMNVWVQNSFSPIRIILISGRVTNSIFWHNRMNHSFCLRLITTVYWPPIKLLICDSSDYFTFSYEEESVIFCMHNTNEHLLNKYSWTRPYNEWMNETGNKGQFSSVR